MGTEARSVSGPEPIVLSLIPSSFLNTAASSDDVVTEATQCEHPTWQPASFGSYEIALAIGPCMRLMPCIHSHLWLVD